MEKIVICVRICFLIVLLWKVIIGTVMKGMFVVNFSNFLLLIIIENLIIFMCWFISIKLYLLYMMY